MAFDAGMMRYALYEIEKESLGARVEKLYQPEKEEVVILIRSRSGGRRIVLGAGSCGRISFTDTARENPPTPPTFCLSLRKHLTGALLTRVEQMGFERVALLEFLSRDEMGFECVRRLYCEIMGRYSNIILTDGEDVVLNALKLVDLTTSSKRQVLPGFKYELPPPQNKKNPLTETEEGFLSSLTSADPDTPAQKFITDTYLGISRDNAAEIVFRASKNTQTTIRGCGGSLPEAFLGFFADLRDNTYSPCIVYREGRPSEYSFAELTSVMDGERVAFDSPSKMLDKCFSDRENESMLKSRASDVLRLLCNAETRINKKLAKQKEELEESAKAEEYKNIGDLITANLYAIKRGDTKVSLIDYGKMDEDGNFETVEVTLDARLSPSQNSASYYKKYNKAKKAAVVLSEQMQAAEEELRYIRSVFDCLSRAATPTELAEIREELAASGYASKMKQTPNKKGQKKANFLRFTTTGGYTVLCGRNNLQNDLLTHKTASAYDYWFHSKNAPGSHCVMLCAGEEEPSEKDFTEAAMIAAVHSSLADSPMAEVDYTLCKHVKKPSGSKPGFVIYHTNYSAYVKPDKDYVKALETK